MYHCANYVWTRVKATFRSGWSHDITSVAHEAIWYSIPPRLQREPGKSPRLQAVGLDGLCNVARGLGGATSQQQKPSLHTDQSGLPQMNGWIRTAAGPHPSTVSKCSHASPLQRHKKGKIIKNKKSRSFKCKRLQMEEVCRIYTVNAGQTNNAEVYLIWSACNPLRSNRATEGSYVSQKWRRAFSWLWGSFAESRVDINTLRLAESVDVLNSLVGHRKWRDSPPALQAF